MIAEHNIKVNGRWIRAGESYEAPGEKKPEPKKQPVKAEPVPEAEKAEEPKAEAKPKSTARRKVAK